MTENIKLEDKHNKNYNSVEGGRKSPEENGGDDYDPHEHRVVANPTTNMETLVHILKGSLGTGILAMPEAFRNSGYVVGILGTFILGALCVYCLLVLVRSQYTLCKRYRVPMLTYPESMKLALSEGPDCLKFLTNASVYIVDGFLIVYQMGICCVYVVFVAENLKQFFDIYVGPLHVQLHILIIFVPLLLISLIKDLKRLAPLSTLANVLTFVGLAICLYYVFQDLPPIKEREMTASIGKLPLFFGTVLFAIEAVGVIITLENNMKTPKSFGGCSGVFNIGMVVIILLYATMGFCGFWKFGEESVGSITLNLPKEDALAQSVRIIFTIAIFISYALQGYVPVEIVWNQHLKKKFEGSNKVVLYEYLIRISNVIITCLLAIAIPRLSLFISLFGAFCLSVLGFVFPAILELCVHWPNDLGPFKWILIKDILITIFGFLGLICGTYTSVRDIVISFSGDP